MLDLMRDIILATDLAHHLRIFKDLQKMAEGAAAHCWGGMSGLAWRSEHLECFCPVPSPFLAMVSLQADLVLATFHCMVPHGML